MRVLHVLTTIDPAGAGPVEAARLYCLASGPDYRPEVLCLDNDVRSWLDTWPVPVHAIGHSTSYERYSSKLIPWLKQHGSRFDAVVVHGVWGYHLVGVYLALRKASIPYFVILHGMLNPWFRRTYRFKHLKKWLAWHAITGRAVAAAAGVLYLCKEERRLARSSFSIQAARELLAPLGTAPLRANPALFADEFPSLRDKRIVLFLGRICYMKGCDILIDAFAEVSRRAPDMQLVFAGPDHERWQKDLILRTRKLGIEKKVTWTGPLYGARKWSALAAAELFILPSRCETFPISVLEALASSTPVLISRDVNIYPEIEATNAGMICDSTAPSLREALFSWLKKGEAERFEFRRRACDCHAHHFSLENAVEMHMAAIQEHAIGIPETAARHSEGIAC